MKATKVARDWLVKTLNGPRVVPVGLVELQRYFRNHGPIEFQEHIEHQEIIAVSTNFRYGSIIATGKNETELDAKIKDAILTAFDVPSVYATEAKLARAGKASHQYAAA